MKSTAMANKRKREELGDSDYDEPAPGKQLLPVANLPSDFDKDPANGMEYLFLVRRDARRLPHVTRAPNPYEVAAIGTAAREEPSSRPVANGLPCDQWRTVFQSHFRNLRQNFAQPTIHVHFDPLSSGRSVMPEKKDRDAWWKYLAGFPESEWSLKLRTSSSRKKSSSLHCMRAFPETAEMQPRDSGAGLHPDLSPDVVQSSVVQDPVCRASPASATASYAENIQDNDPMEYREVTPSHLRKIDHRMAIHLLMYFTHWINLHLQNSNDALFSISGSHARWIFALLVKVEDQLSADDMNLLRNLARACLGLIKSHRNRDREQDEVLRPNADQVGKGLAVTDASCWMIFCAIAGHWGQRDLWIDAEAALTSA
ncbi:survival motor neuron interacting protein 1-domain-containing protein [Phlebopus sp. FC_14]|nr:survival motor neuron interacting protein 1-domain-containing protein [Phlebopus sp. FC_14]